MTPEEKAEDWLACAEAAYRAAYRKGDANKVAVAQLAATIGCGHATLATAPADEARDTDQAAEVARREGGAAALVMAADALPDGTPRHVRMLLRRWSEQTRAGERWILPTAPKEETQ